MPITDNTDAYTKKIDICFEEKSRLEEHFKYIVKVYMVLLAAYFAYTTFAINTLETKHDKSIPIVVQFENNKIGKGKLVTFDEVKKDTKKDAEEEGYGKVLYSVFGLVFAVITVMYGWYAVMGIAHIVRKRAFYTNEIEKTSEKLAKYTSADITFKPYDSDLIKQFKKVPVIYTWSALILVFSSYLYFFFIFDGDVEKAVWTATGISVIAIAYVPSINIHFYEQIRTVNVDFSGQSCKFLSPDIAFIKKLIIMIIILLSMELGFAFYYNNYKYWYMGGLAIFIFYVISVYITEKTSKKGWFYNKGIIAVRPFYTSIILIAETVSIVAIATHTY